VGHGPTVQYQQLVKHDLPVGQPVVSTEILYIPPQNLEPHPINRRLPRFARESSEWKAFLDDIDARGIKTPLKITENRKVVDGETRRQAAVVLGPNRFSVVPCVVVEDDDVLATIASEIALRRNLGKGARAYLVYPMVKDLLEEAKRRHLENLRTGNPMLRQPKGTKGKWAVLGCARGYQEGEDGRSYAIVTVIRPGQKRSVPLPQIREQVNEMYAFARAHPDLIFLVPRAGDRLKPSLNGYTLDENASCFLGSAKT